MIKRLADRYRHIPVAAKVSFWSFVCSAVQKAIVMLTVPIITRMLTTAEYGRYSVFVSYGNIFIIFGTLSLYANGYYVGMKRYDADRRRYTSSVAGLMILLTTVCLGILLGAQNWVTAHTGLGRTACLLLIVWMYGQGAIDLWFRENRYEFKYRLIVICTVFTALATPVLKIGFIEHLRHVGGDKAMGAILGYVLPAAMVGLVAWASIFRKSRSLYVREYWSFALRFNIPLIPYYLSQNILNQADRIMIERLDSASAAGIYSVAYSAATAIAIVNQAVNSSYIPWQFQKMQRGEHERVAKTGSLLMLMVAAFHMLLIFMAPELMKVFASAEYSQAIYVIPPVTIGVMLVWLTQTFINAEFYYEKNRMIAVSSVLSAVLNVILNAIAIPQYGYLAAAYTTLICYLANMVFHGAMAVRLLRKMNVGRTFELKKIVVLTGGCIAAMFAVMALYGHFWVRYGLLLAAVAVALLKRRELMARVNGLWRAIRRGES